MTVTPPFEHPADTDRPAIPGTWRGATIGLYLFFVAISLLQQPGLTTYDTRAELTVRPGSFLAEAFTLWHPESNFGEFQNQAYGYLFPQGTWFLLGDRLGAPDWVWQRLWTALVLVVACEGARRVARVVGFARPLALVAGLAFAFSPRLLGTVPVLTGESLPGAVMPWALLPVLVALRRPPTGHRGWLRAAALSGAAVVCMGGVNAVEVIGALPVIAIVVVWGVRRGLAPRRFLVFWAGALLVAATWWLLPLLVLAGYSPPFYEYVESAANTTALIGWSEATRGDSHWVAYLITGDQSWWPAAHDLVATPWLIVLSAVISAVGLWGLARWRHALRTPFLLAMVVGLGALTIAHGGWPGSPVSGSVRGLLDGALQIFRNVHKIDPVVRLPLALGLAHAVALLVRWVGARRAVLAANPAPLIAVPLLLVLALGQPYLVNRSRTPGWEEIATPWQQAQAYLADHEDGRTTLVLPGSGFAQETWGWTLDEPLQVLGGVNRTIRSQVPIIPGQSIRYLAALDQLASTGRASQAFAAQLARAGIGHVVIRRDLVRALTGSPYPGASSVSAAKGGLRSVAQYGEQVEGGAEVEVLEVPQTVPTLRTTPLDDVRTVRGAPESVLGLQETGLVSTGEATVLEGEPGWDRAADVVTDGDQRRERAFGVSDESVSAVLGPDDPWRTDRAVHDFPTVPDAQQVVARYRGLSRLSASSAQGYADNFGPVVPQAAPYAAVDGDPDTRWVSSAAGDPDEQWIRLDFDSPRPVYRVSVLPVVDDPTIVPPRTFEVLVGDQTRTVAASPSGAPTVVRFDGTAADFVEVRITEARTSASQARVGLREVSVDGLAPTRTLVVPGSVGADGSWVFATTPERRACSITVGAPDCDASRIRGSEEPAGMDRTFSTDTSGTYTIRGLVVARTTREAARLLDPVAPRSTGATSIYGNDPQVADRFAYDGADTTTWVSADEDRSPTLFLNFARPRTLSEITVTPGAGSTPPTRVVVRSETAVRVLDLRDGYTRRFAPLQGQSFQVTFVKGAGARHVAIAELRLRGVNLTRLYDPGQETGAVCGLGPSIQVDGTTVPTRVTGTLADVANGSPLTFASCHPDRSGNRDVGDRGEFTLDAGQHRLTAPPTQEFQVTELAGVPDRSSGSGFAPSRSVRITAWGDSHRVAEVGAGDASLLYLPENFNAGWAATVDGHRLQALRVDGWQQAWVLPAGGAVEVDLTYAPQRAYRVLLPLGLGLSGALVLLALALLALGAVRRRRAADPADPADSADPAGDDGAPWPEPAPSARTLPVAVLTGVALVALGPVAATGIVLGFVVRSRPWLELAAALVVGSAVLDVSGGPLWSLDVADAMAAAAVGLVVGAVLADGPARSPHPPRTPSRRLVAPTHRGSAPSRRQPAPTRRGEGGR